MQDQYNLGIEKVEKKLARVKELAISTTQLFRVVVLKNTRSICLGFLSKCFL